MNWRYPGHILHSYPGTDFLKNSALKNCQYIPSYSSSPALRFARPLLQYASLRGLYVLPCFLPTSTILFSSSLAGGVRPKSSAETTRTGKREPRGSREEVGRRKNLVFAEFTRRYNADGTWQESFTRSPVWTMKVEDRLIPASL